MFRIKKTENKKKQSPPPELSPEATTFKFNFRTSGD